MVAILLVIGAAVAFMNYQTVAAGQGSPDQHAADDGHNHAEEGRELPAPAPSAAQSNQEDMKSKLSEATGGPPGPKLPADDKPKVLRPGADEPRLKPDDNAISSQWYRDGSAKSKR